MLKAEEFIKLKRIEKKQTLVSIFSQLNDENDSFGNTIFLLNVSNKINDSTLNQIYKDLSDLLQNWKSLSQQKYLDKIKQIQTQIQKDTEKESIEADSLLDNI